MYPKRTFPRWDWSFASELDTPFPHWTNWTYHLIQTSSSSFVFSLNHLFFRYFNEKPKLVTFEWFDLCCFWKLQPIFLAEVEKQSYLIASSKNTNQRALKWSNLIGGKVHSFKWTLLGKFYFELCRFLSIKKIHRAVIDFGCHFEENRRWEVLRSKFGYLRPLFWKVCFDSSAWARILVLILLLP